MYFRCPACHKHSIFFLTKFIFLASGKLRNSFYQANYFRCTSCQQDLKCYYQLMPLLLVGVLVGITCSSIIGDGYDLLSPFPIFFAIAALFTYPILRADSTAGGWSGHIRTFGLALALILASVLLWFLKDGVSIYGG